MAVVMRRLFTLCSLAMLLGAGCVDAPSNKGEASSKPEGNKTATEKASEKTADGMKRLVFLTNGDDPYWDTCGAGFKEAGEKLELKSAGYIAEFQKGDGKLENQIKRLRQYATESDIAGVAISVINADNKGISQEMEKLRDQGVAVITVDGDVNREKYPKARAYYIGTNNTVAGQTLGIAAKALLEGRGLKSGGYVQFAGFRDNDNARARMNGVKETIGESYKELDRMPDEMKLEVAHKNVRNALDKFEKDDLVALVGIWAYNTPAIANVVTERKLRDKITILCVDAAQDSIRHMGEGNVDVMVVQNPFDMGYQAVRLLKGMAAKDEALIKEMFPKPAGEPDADVYTTGLRVVVPDEKSPIKAELFDAKTIEFMTLPVFQEWLKKYNLKSS